MGSCHQGRRRKEKKISFVGGRLPKNRTEGGRGSEKREAKKNSRGAQKDQSAKGAGTLRKKAGKKKEKQAKHASAERKELPVKDNQ